MGLRLVEVGQTLACVGLGQLALGGHVAVAATSAPRGALILDWLPATGKGHMQTEVRRLFGELVAAGEAPNTAALKASVCPTFTSRTSSLSQLTFLCRPDLLCPTFPTQAMAVASEQDASGKSWARHTGAAAEEEEVAAAAAAGGGGASGQCITSLPHHLVPP